MKKFFRPFFLPKVRQAVRKWSSFRRVVKVLPNSQEALVEVHNADLFYDFTSFLRCTCNAGNLLRQKSNDT